MLRIPIRFFACVASIFAMTTVLVQANENTVKGAKRQPANVITVTNWGPSQAEIDAAKSRAERSTAVKTLLAGKRYRLLEFNYVDTGQKSAVSVPPTHFRAVFYDYSEDRTFAATGDFAGKEAIAVKEESYYPNATEEEFDEAATILAKDGRFTAVLKSESLEIYRPMPPVTVLDGTTVRLINVGILTRGENGSHEIVSVNLNNGSVMRYPDKAPPASSAEAGSCGLGNSGQGSTGQGLAGQYQLTITQNAAPLWEMLVVRPSASSGSRASGIEIRDVKYKGKSVLKRGHVPVLNVQYSEGSCGPYRDWQYAEGNFDAPAAGATYPNGTSGGIVVLAPGQVARTILESGTDTGNFRGVAIYSQDVGHGNETVLVTEMNAGWYRYLMEWRFADDGTIRPRYGFGATTDSCVCNKHNHHAYWRFDFDVVSPVNKVFQIERGRKFQQPITAEIRRDKNHQTRRSLLVQNSAGDEAYMLVPNMSDGLVDTFGVNDFWVLRYKSVVGGTNVQNQIDDGVTCVTCPGMTGAIQINSWVNGESLVDQDAVVWYGAHFGHSDGANMIDPDRSPEVLSGSHVVGPDIRPVRW